MYENGVGKILVGHSKLNYEHLSMNVNDCFYLFLSQAARVTHSGYMVKETALEIRSRPIGYENTQRYELDSFVIYCSNLTLTVCPTILTRLWLDYACLFICSSHYITSYILGSIIVIVVWCFVLLLFIVVTAI